MKTIKFKLKEETKGAWRYVEIDDKGNEIPLIDAVIGTLYLRKKATPERKETIEIVIK